jgi:hypothetical protein
MAQFSENESHGPLGQPTPAAGDESLMLELLAARLPPNPNEIAKLAQSGQQVLLITKDLLASFRRNSVTCFLGLDTV